MNATPILLIEDNADSRETMRMVLEMYGHRVDTAADGADGVRKALADRPPVAIVDIGLPRLTGYEVARRLRTALGAGIFLIALTGYNRPEDRRRSREAGFDIHLCKPADLEPLLCLLREKSPPRIRPAPRPSAIRTILRQGPKRTQTAKE